MIICIGPVCVPVWPLLFLGLKPIWNLLPEAQKETLRTFWFDSCYPALEPYLSMLPEKVRKFMFYGMPGGKKKDKTEGGSSASKDGGVEMAVSSRVERV